MAACTLDHNWPYYVIFSLITLFGGVAILLPLHIGWTKTGERRRQLVAKHRNIHTCLSKFRSAANFILAGNTTFSKIIMICFWLADITACVVYMVEATLADAEDVANCTQVTPDTLNLIWISAMCLGVLRFIIKFVASNDKLFMWIDIYSIVDHFTIGPTFVGLYFSSNWLGLRFFRIIYLLNTSDILQMVHIIKSRSRIRLVKALTAVATVWTFGAGMYHLLENNGDPFNDYSNGRKIEFWNCFYLVLITLTTIGYGDISPQTVLGKAFTVIFVVLALATFGTLIPELSKELSSRNRFRKAYKRTFGKRHLVICGGITFETITAVVKNFIHEDSSMKKTDIIIIDVQKPSAELQAFFRRHFNDVTFIQGTVLDIPTLKLAKAQQADAVLILANRRAQDQDEEDLANIMRATAVKNLSANIRIILQLLQHHNKEQLLHIPGWNWYRANSNNTDDVTVDDDDGSDITVGGDEVICISELKLGFMAQNCLAPGIVTILSNLICMRSYKPGNNKSWMDNYCYGAGHEIYTGKFSKDFTGMTFTDAAILCMSEFGVLLVGVNIPEKGGCKLRINPGSRLKLQSDHVGFFIAQGPQEVHRISEYKIAKSLTSQTSISSETSKLIPMSVKSCSSSSSGGGTDDVVLELVDSDNNETFPAARVQTGNNDDDDNNNEQDLFDSTNRFHWCHSRSLDTAVLNADSIPQHSFSDHIIFVLCASCSSTSSTQEIGLVNFVKPLRSSSILTHNLQTIIFYCDLSVIESDWHKIAHFPKIFVFPRSRSISSDLRALGVQRCSMCLVLGPSDVSKIDETLIDQQAILTTKNILSLRKIADRVAQFGVLANAEKFQQQLAMINNVSMLIELEHDASIAYIDDDDDDDPNVPVFQTIPYVCGKVLLASVVDSLVAAAYMNTDILTLVRALLTGGESTEFENVLTEGVGLVRQTTLVRSPAARQRSSLALLSLSEHGLLRHIQHGYVYGQLATNALKTYGLLCLGLYRTLDDGPTKEQMAQKRYVLTHPPFDFQLIPSDKVYVLKPFEFDSNASISVIDDVSKTDDDVTDRDV